MSAWAIGCVVFATVLIAGVCITVPPLRRRRTDIPAPVEPQPDDYPTAPIPVIPAAPGRELSERLMLRGDELLWHKGAEDDEGAITLGLLPAGAGDLGVLMDVDGEAAGVRLDRFEVQGLRDALTCHLVNTAKPVRQ